MKGFTMTDENKLGENLTFISGAVRYSDLIYFALQSDGIDTALDPHFYPVTFDDGTWGADITVERPKEMATDTAAKLPAIRHCIAATEVWVNVF